MLLSTFLETLIVATTLSAPVDTLTEADFELPIEISESDIHSLENFGILYAPWLKMPDFMAENLVDEMVDYARKFTGTRYRTGGKKPGGFDCSGLVGYVFRHFGITLGASSAIQSREGVPVNPSELRPGDLLFFSRGRGNGRVGHVGMVTEVDPATGHTRFIHATTRSGVIESDFPDGGHYSSRFICARRIIGK